MDDATRLADVEAPPDERRGSATAFLTRAMRWFRERGARIERIMTDNGSCYVSGRFRKAARWLGARHIRTRPCTPKTSGKAPLAVFRQTAAGRRDRFIHTLLREWASAIPYRPPEARNADLSRWLDWFNRKRPHSALNAQPPLLAMNSIMRRHT